MTRGEIRDRLRRLVPSAASSRMTDDVLNTLINKAVRDVNRECAILVETANFGALDGVSEYNLTTNVPDLAGWGESGLWYNKGSVASPNYDQLDGVNRNYLNRYYPRWQDQSSGNPLYVIKESQRVIVYPAPSADLTDGFLLPDYIQAPTEMSNDDDYPFTGSSAESPIFEVLDDAIIDYCRWSMAWSVGQKQEGMLTRKEYEETREAKASLYHARPDYKAHRWFRKKSRLGIG